MPRVLLVPPLGQIRHPDVGNWAWHEYGNRVGFWRFHELFERLGIRPTLSVNGRVCVDYPRIMEAVNHGWTDPDRFWVGAFTYAISKMLTERDVKVTHLMFNVIEMVVAPPLLRGSACRSYRLDPGRVDGAWCRSAGRCDPQVRSTDSNGVDSNTLTAIVDSK